jgi:recombinational DNA repair protein (RecF pathway)
LEVDGLYHAIIRSCHLEEATGESYDEALRALYGKLNAREGLEPYLPECYRCGNRGILDRICQKCAKRAEADEGKATKFAAKIKILQQKISELARGKGSDSK